MPPEHGRRLAALLPDARLLEVSDSSTLIPLDQPVELARAIREFVRDTRSDSEIDVAAAPAAPLGPWGPAAAGGPRASASVAGADTLRSTAGNHRRDAGG